MGLGTRLHGPRSVKSIVCEFGRWAHAFGLFDVFEYFTSGTESFKRLTDKFTHATNCYGRKQIRGFGTPRGERMF